MCHTKNSAYTKAGSQLAIPPPVKKFIFYAMSRKEQGGKNGGGVGGFTIEILLRNDELTLVHLKV